MAKGKTKGIKPFNGTGDNDIIEISEFEGPGSTKINGGDGDDHIIGSGLSDRVNAGDGDDTVEGGLGNDRLFGNGGTDTAVFSGNVRAYTITEGKGNSIIVDGPDGRDELKHFEFLQFDDFTIDLSTYDFDGNNAPLVNPVAATVDEDPSNYLSASTSAPLNLGNSGDFYLFDADTGVMTVANRTGSVLPLDEAGSLADVNGIANGVIILAESNNGPFITVRAYSVADGVTTAVETPDFDIGGFGGTTETVSDANTGQDVFKATGADNAFDITVEIDDVAFANGSTGDFQFTLNGATTSGLDTFTADGASFQAVIDGPSPDVEIVPDAIDLEGDEFVFSFDDTGTVGTVEYNPVTETFLYSADGAFEFLEEGQEATDTFTYTATDEHGMSATETVTITIDGADELSFI